METLDFLGGIMIPFVILALTNCWVVFWNKKSFGISLPATLTGTVLLTYFSQLLFHTFNIGIYVCLAAAVSAVILLILRRKDRDFISRCFSEGFFVFLAICLFFLVMDYGRWLSEWDEYSHWGKMVKEMFRLDRFYSEPQSDLLVHKDYPPFAVIFEMLWCRFSGGYSAGGATMALHIFGFSMVLPLALEQLNGEKKTGRLQKFISKLAIVAAFLLLICNFNHVQPMTIYLDLFLPLFYVSLILMTADRELRRSGFGFTMILLGQFGLIITKQMGLAFVLLVWFFYTMLEALELSSEGKVSQEKKSGRWVILAVKSLAILITPAVSYSIWNHYITNLGLTGQFSFERINIGTIIRILAGGGDYIQHLTYVKFIRALFTTNLGTGIFSMTYVSAVLLAFCILAVLAYLFRTVVHRGEILQYAVLFAVGSAGYAFTMLVLYMFCYSEGEMSVLASYERYMSTYILSEYVILFLLLVRLLARKKVDVCTYPVALGMLGIGLLMAGTGGVSQLMPQMFCEKDGDYKEQADEIQRLTPADTEVFLISSHNDVYTYILTYYLDDRRIDKRYLTSNVATWGADNTDYWNAVLNCIREDGYVYLYNVTDEVRDALGQYMDDEFVEQALYVAVEQNGELRLQRAW